MTWKGGRRKLRKGDDETEKKDNLEDNLEKETKMTWKRRRRNPRQADDMGWLRLVVS